MPLFCLPLQRWCSALLLVTQQRQEERGEEKEREKGDNRAVLLSLQASPRLD